MKKPSHKTMTIIYLIIFLYIIAGVLLYKFQKQLIFRPTPLSPEQAYHFSHPFREFNIPLNDSARLNAVLLKADSARGIVIYFHGNTGNIIRYSPYASIFLQHGYDVLMMDYPGYGKSTGPDTEQDLYRDALLMYQLAQNYFPADNIVIYGKSLGSAMAARLASRRFCQALILECPLYNFDALARRYFPIYPVSWMLQYHFPVNEFIPHVLVPIMIFHGGKDRIIPYSQVKKLRPLLKPGDEFITLPSAGHNDIYDQPVYRAKMDSLLTE